jgi:hypothetical protein
MVLEQLLLGVNYNMYQENIIPWSSSTLILNVNLEYEIKTCANKYE